MSGMFIDPTTIADAVGNITTIQTSSIVSSTIENIIITCVVIVVVVVMLLVVYALIIHPRLQHAKEHRRTVNLGAKRRKYIEKKGLTKK